MGKTYRFARAPGHPRANNVGWAQEHVLVVESVLGRHLRGTEEVHHVNGDRTDNRPGNLVACPDRAYHMLLHQRQRSLDACGCADWVKCKFCKQYDHPANVYDGGPSRQRYHRKCKNAYETRRRQNVKG